VNVLHDEYLYGKLMEYVKGYEDEDLIFSDRDTIRHQYAEYGIKSHDLRRLNAKRRLRLEMEEKGKTKSAARKVVQMELGHASGSTTNIYLKERSDVGELTRG
jgi:integrase